MVSSEQFLDYDGVIMSDRIEKKQKQKKPSKSELQEMKKQRVKDEFELHMKRERSRTREALSQCCLDLKGRPIQKSHDHSIALDMLRDVLSCSETIYLQAILSYETNTFVILCNDKSVYSAKDNIQVWAGTTAANNKPEVVESVIAIISCFLTAMDYEVVVERSAYQTGIFDPYNIRDSEENMKSQMEELLYLSSLG